MKVKYDFVTNSSSTSYIVENKSKTDNLTARSFVESIWPHIQKEIDYYEFNTTKEKLIKSLELDYGEYFPLDPLEERYMVWGDEDGTTAGLIFDYCLRGGVETGIVRVTYEESIR